MDLAAEVVAQAEELEADLGEQAARPLLGHRLEVVPLATTDPNPAATSQTSRRRIARRRRRSARKRI